SMVEYDDGSVLAQMGTPDMRTPIAYGLGFPCRIEAGVSPLDLVRAGRLDFQEPDLQRFPCLRLAWGALEAGQSASTALNAANEVAVAALRAERLPLTGSAEVIDGVLSAGSGQAAAPEAVEDVLSLDRAARACAHREIERRAAR